MPPIVFLLIVSSIWLGLHGYVGVRLIRPSQLPGRAKAVLWSLNVVAWVLTIAALVTPRIGQGSGLLQVLQWSGLLVFGVFTILLTFVMLADVVKAGAWLARRVLGPSRERSPDDAGRRRFFGRLATGTVLGSTGALGAVGVAQARTTAKVVRVDVPIEGLPAALDGFTIGQLSDIHVGPTIRRADLQAMVDRVNALQPDMIAVTGDLVDGYVDQLREQVGPVADLDAVHGAFFVTGNHEYYWDGVQWCDHVASLGLTVLNNEHVVLDHNGARLLVAGVTDYRAGGHVAAHASDPAKAKRGAPTTDASILLAHQPSSVFAAAEVGFDLQLSGHTHGGQYFPASILVHLAQPYVAGLHRHAKRMWIYVSRGTGYWGPPLRVGAPHEITLLTLRSA